jgi:hypothetical protein
MRLWYIRLSLFLLFIGPISLNGCGDIIIEEPEIMSHNDVNIKVITKEEGFYELSAAELVKKGFPFESILHRDIRLFQRGNPLPFWIDELDGNVKIRFFSKSSSSRYSAEQVTIISSKKQIREGKQIEKPSCSSDIQDFPRILNFQYLALEHLEENNFYQPQAGINEPWLWFSLYAPQKEELEVLLSDVSTGAGQIQLILWTSTESIKNPDHHLRLFVNDIEIGDYYMDGIGVHTLEAEIPVGTLKNGNNKISFYSPGVDEVIADVIWIDWINLLIVKDAFPVDDVINYPSQGQELNLMNFSGAVDIYTVDCDRVERIVEQLGINSKWVGEDNRDYWIVGPSGYRSPDSIERISNAMNDDQEFIGADYIIISADELLEGVNSLLAHRQKQGFQVLSLPTSYVDNYFNHGFREPSSIRNFIKWAHETWSIKPKYLLLVGDTSYDYREYQFPQNNNGVIPSFFVKTKYGGETVSDIGFSEISGDDWTGGLSATTDRRLSISVGRLPVQNKTQLENYIDKLIKYEKFLLANHTQGVILAIADRDDQSFRMNSESFLSVFQQNRKTNLLILPNNTSANQLGNFLDKNLEVIVYYGHGSISQWGRDGILKKEDIKNFYQDDYLPIVIQMTCLSGYFVHPEVQSISESMLLKSNGGAIAVIAPTSLTLPTDQQVLSTSLAKQYVSDNHNRVGDVFIAAWNQAAMGRIKMDDLLNTYLLLGDPALLLRQ